MSVDPPKSNAQPDEDPGRRGPTSEAERVRKGTVSPERMREVLRRLDRDHYSSTEVQDLVAHAVLQVGLSRTE